MTLFCCHYPQTAKFWWIDIGNSSENLPVGMPRLEKFPLRTFPPFVPHIGNWGVQLWCAVRQSFFLFSHCGPITITTIIIIIIAIIIHRFTKCLFGINGASNWTQSFDKSRQQIWFWAKIFFVLTNCPKQPSAPISFLQSCCQCRGWLRIGCWILFYDTSWSSRK